MNGPLSFSRHNERFQYEPSCHLISNPDEVCRRNPREGLLSCQDALRISHITSTPGISPKRRKPGHLVETDKIDALKIKKVAEKSQLAGDQVQRMETLLAESWALLRLLGSLLCSCTSNPRPMSTKLEKKLESKRIPQLSSSCISFATSKTVSERHRNRKVLTGLPWSCIIEFSWCIFFRKSWPESVWRTRPQLSSEVMLSDAL